MKFTKVGMFANHGESTLADGGATVRREKGAAIGPDKKPLKTATGLPMRQSKDGVYVEFGGRDGNSRYNYKLYLSGDDVAGILKELSRDELSTQLKATLTETIVRLLK